MSIIQVNDSGYREYEPEKEWAKAHADRLMEEHTASSVLAHPDGSVTEAKIANGAVSRQKLSGELESGIGELEEHMVQRDNPHGVDKAQVGLGNVENVRQASKAELDLHTEDRNNPHCVTKSQIGLGSVDNTPDIYKPVSRDMQRALDGKTDKAYSQELKQEIDSNASDIAGLAGELDGVRGDIGNKADVLCLDTATDKTHTITDSSDSVLKGVSVYGETTQIGTPSLETPAQLVTVENPTLTIKRSEDDESPETVTLPYRLNGIKHPTTGEWLVRDEIKVENGKVTYVRNINEYVPKSFIDVLSYGLVTTYAHPNAIEAEIYDDIRYAVVSPQFVTGFHRGTSYPVLNQVAIGYPGGFRNRLLVYIGTAELGITSEDDQNARNTKANEWLKNYNATHDIPITFYYALKTPSVTDITDTDAGKALLELASCYPNTIVECDTDCKISYKADTTNAYHNLKAELDTINQAIISLGGTI